MAYSPPEVDRIWLWVYENEIPKYLIFYLIKEDYSCKDFMGYLELHTDQRSNPNNLC